jgi:antitoxin component HigA of HigAB toxin-antitoxin module
MLAHMKTLHTDNGITELTLRFPTEEAPKITDIITGLFRLTGHEITDEEEEEIDDDKRYTLEEVFPDLCPAMILRGFRSSRELSQAELAEKLGIKQSRLSELESGKRPISRKMAAKLGKIFDMPPKTFITV